ncbi:hypothetical protein LU290_07490 [Moraxella nasibovis]|uniref:hypothetical protein n=1 Tax=Moraxella nasibovis TaxID=2904120 RepID=UPI00240F2E50|nr:hypothetical protein [Moraxella nasibovis]WFF38100.1 hypothetical protein LU290_07490 [Moraxella nasibovis]
MQIQYDHLDYQKQAIDSIVDLFQGEITHHQDDFSLSDKDSMRVIANELSLSKDDIFDNLKNIQTQNQLSLSDKLHIPLQMITCSTLHETTHSTLI